MTTPELTPTERRKATFLVRWALVNLFLTAAAAGLTLWIWLAEQNVRGQLVRVIQRTKQGCEQRVIVAPKPQIVEPDALAPAQDPPKSGYIGNKGTDITPTMRLMLEALRDKTPPGKLDSLRLGAPDVLPPSTIHVVNLWATWCGPCKDEMPDFKAMFERNPAWGSNVQFVPILVKDPNEPRKAYGDFAAVMPPTPVKLADRSYEEALVTALAPDEQVKLFHGNLPVTLVLDCNRRVRWAKFEQLNEDDFAELESYVNKFTEELADTSHGSWCTQVWAGNGRCEGNENTAANHSLEDCGELKRRPGQGPPGSLGPDDAGLATNPNGTPVAPTTCPVGQDRNATGQCVPRLRGHTLPKPKPPPSPAAQHCGDGKCEPARGESHQTCCQDCPCNAPLVCRQDGSDKFKCGVKGLKM